MASLFRAVPAAGSLVGPAGQAALAAREAQGFAAGHAAAVAELTAELTAVRDAADAALRAEHAGELAEARATVRCAMAALDAALAESLAELAVDLCRAVLAAEPAVAPETLRSLVAEALAALPEGALGVVSVAPDALGAAEGLLPPGWRVRADASLVAGVLRAEIDAATVTASLDRRLVQLAAGLPA